MSIAKLARPELRKLQAYQAAIQVDHTVRLNANEAPVSAAADGFRRPLNRYPEVRPQALSRKLCKRFNCEASQLLVTRGSSEAIDLLLRTFCRAGIDSIVTSAPTFSMYRHYALVQNAGIVEVTASAEADFVIDVDALLGACSKECRIVFVCSPNNPTGRSISRADLERLAAARRHESIVVVDEAYIEFSSATSMIETLDRHPNLVVLRTLSKAMGVAGARCGVAIANTEVIDLLDAVQAPYAMATPVVECIERILDSADERAEESTVESVRTERSRVAQAIGQFSFTSKVWPSDANFILIEVNDAAATERYCRESGVLIRPFTGSLAACLRISIGSRVENDRLLAVLQEFANE